MNKTKKIVGALTLASFLLACPFLAQADSNDTGTWDDDGKTDITVTLPATYTVEIPASFAFTATGTQTGTVRILDTTQIHDADALTVKLATTNTLTASKTYNAGANTSQIPLTLTYGTSATAYASASEATLLDKTGADIGVGSGLSTDIVVGVASFADAKVAGAHTGTLDFSVVYTAAP
jgi:hypothetical protein